MEENKHLLRPGVELEPVDREDVLAAVVHAARGEAMVEWMRERFKMRSNVHLRRHIADGIG